MSPLFFASSIGQFIESNLGNILGTLVVLAPGFLWLLRTALKVGSLEELMAAHEQSLKNLNSDLVAHKLDLISHVNQADMAAIKNGLSEHKLNVDKRFDQMTETFRDVSSKIDKLTEHLLKK